MRRRLVLAALFLCAPARASVFDFLPEALLGKEMPPPPGAARKEPTRSITLNGFPLSVSTGRSTRSVKDLLDFYQERYPGGVLKELVGKPVGIRREGNETGTLMSIEVPDKATALEVMDGKRTLVSAGPLRMVYARRSGVYTDYLMAWSARPMPQAVLQPVQSGDAPGADLPGVPRPTGGVRTFSFTEEKAGYQMAMYQLAAGPADGLRAAAARMTGDGWQEDGQFAESAAKKLRLVRRFTKGKRDAVVTARPAKDLAGIAQLTYLLRDL